MKVAKAITPTILHDYGQTLFSRFFDDEDEAPPKIWTEWEEEE